MAPVSLAVGSAPVTDHITIQLAAFAKVPAPENLLVPVARFDGETELVIGKENA
jgi:Rieske Fe-S protein